MISKLLVQHQLDQLLQCRWPQRLWRVVDLRQVFLVKLPLLLQSFQVIPHWQELVVRLQVLMLNKISSNSQLS
jgi:hypothetical protein